MELCAGLVRKPGALRNDASFKDWDLPPGLAKVRAKMKSHADGDRQFVKVLGAVRHARQLRSDCRQGADPAR